MTTRIRHECPNCGPFFGSNECPRCRKIVGSLCLNCLDVTTRRTVRVTKLMEKDYSIDKRAGTHVCQACAFGEKKNGSTNHGVGPICAAYGCTTRLNMYNGQGLCHLHARMQGHKKMCMECGETLEHGNPGPYCLPHGKCTDCGAQIAGGEYCGDCAPQTMGVLFSKARAQRNPRLVVSAIEDIRSFREDVIKDIEEGKIRTIWGKYLVELCNQAIGSVEKGVEMGVAEFIEKYDSYYQEL